MAETHFEHGDLPVEVAPRLRCPASATPGHPHWPAALVEPVLGSGYRAKFRCSACRFEFTVSDAQLKKVPA